MSQLVCEHCGADCGSSPVVWNAKQFCCYGCKTVYEILHEKDLGQYYDIQPAPGIRIENPQQLKKFAFLDNPEIAEKLIGFKDGNTSKTTFFIPTIHCASCIWLLEHLNTLHPGITFSDVNFPKKEVHITFNNDQLTIRQLAELLSAIHYVPEITLDRLETKKPGKTNRSLLIKIGVASFSFLNIMMYSFPEYLPGGDLLEQDFKDIFGWLSFFLILPVVFYSANDYYLSAWKGLKHKIISIDVPITLGILALFLQSSWEVFNGNGIGYMDSLAGLIFFLLIGKWYQEKTYQALSFERNYKSYFPVAVTRIDGVDESITLISELRKGDRILVRNMELIPADARIVKGKGNIDYSFVTGEALPVPKNEGDFIYAGGRQVGSSIELNIEKEVEQSYLTQLWNQKSFRDEKSLLKTHVNMVSHYFTIAVLMIAFTAFFYWLQKDLSTAVYVFASVLIIACPCALALTVPFAFGTTMRVFGRRGFYLKKTDVVEQIYRTNSIVFDKTGTITINREVDVKFQGADLSSEDKNLLHSLVKHSSHPLSITLKEFLKDHQAIEPDSYEEIPGMGITGKFGEVRINIGSKQFVTGTSDDISITESRVYISINNQMRGHFSISNVYRDGLKEVIARLGKKYQLHLISGDNEAEKQRLTSIFGSSASIHFNQSPTDKKAYIMELQNRGEKVLMIGDGLNDAGALAASDTGITIADDVFSFSPACDAIMSSSMFGQLDRFIAFTRSSFAVVRSSFVISLIYNLVGLSFAVSAMLSPLIAAILMPLSSITVVAFATLSVNWLAKRKLPVS
ncbi:MAG: heavy metal translocating P-type ATPase metal-binding domain-containing protein [Bacteroidales bacterium]|nr:heavy metal translocating P-type ATPase metal-binding domain-containing protein [Bacteroidales bacterium]